MRDRWVNKDSNGQTRNRKKKSTHSSLPTVSSITWLVEKVCGGDDKEGRWYASLGVRVSRLRLQPGR